MNHRKLSRLIAAGALTTLLAFPAIARADMASAAEPDGFWKWISNVWQQGISAIWAESEAPEVGPGTGTAAGAAGQGDVGPGVDPNG
jgi:hypothetical protein